MLKRVTLLYCLALPPRHARLVAPKPKPAKATAWKPAVPFIEDDYGRASHWRKERKLPVFIEGWAPW